MRRSLGWLLLCAACSGSVLGCAGQDTQSDEVEAVAQDDVTSVAALVGSYQKGRGIFAVLDLTQVEEGGKKKNRFTADRVEQCASASCPSETVRGSWFARAGRITFYYDDGEQLSAYVRLDERELTLKNARGTVIASLEKAIDGAPGLDAVLARYGVPEMTVEITEEQIAEHGEAKVGFHEAFDAAVDLFVNDGEGLSGVAGEMSLEDFAPYCGERAPASFGEGVLCIANRSSTVVRLYAPDADTPPGGDSPSESWVFEFFADFSDHGYYAVIAKDGSSASIYAFN